MTSGKLQKKKYIKYRAQCVATKNIAYCGQTTSGKCNREIDVFKWWVNEQANQPGRSRSEVDKLVAALFLGWQKHKSDGEEIDHCQQHQGGSLKSQFCNVMQ